MNTAFHRRLGAVKPTVAWFAVIASCAGASAHAQTRNAEGLEEVIVTAQKRSQNLQDVPISISVLKGDRLDQSSTVGVTEALNRVAGVVTLADGMRAGGSQITMRGVGASSSTYNGSSPIGYYLDSVPIALIRQAFVPDANAYDLSRVEVLRGPQGTLYGANAENGLVRIITNDADLTAFDLKARATLSSTDGGGENYRGDLAVNAPLIDDVLAVRAVVGVQDFGGWIDQPNKRDMNDSQLRSYRVRINAKPSKDLSIDASAWRSEGDRGAPSVARDDGQSASIADQSASSEFNAYSLHVSYEFEGFTLESMTGHVQYDSHDKADLDPVGGPFAGVVISSDFSSRTFSQELVLNSTMPGPWRWTLGAFYRDTKDGFFEAAPAFGGYHFDNRDTAESYAAFGELSRKFAADKLELTLGARYFNEDLTNKVVEASTPYNTGIGTYNPRPSFNATTPRVVLTWYPGEDVTVYGSYAEGFRSGIPNTFAIAIIEPATPPVRPDKLHNYELGIKAAMFDGALSFDGAAYYIDWEDVQQNTIVGNESISFITVANAGTASGPGVDIGVTVNPVQGLGFGLTASWNDLTFDHTVFAQSGAVLFGKGERLGYSSERTIGAFLDYQMPLASGRLIGSFSASANYSSEQITRFVSTAGSAIDSGDDLLLARASFGLSDAEERWRASLFVDNLNNEDGRAGPASLFEIENYYPRVRPCTVGLQLEYHW